MAVYSILRFAVGSGSINQPWPPLPPPLLLFSFFFLRCRGSQCTTMRKRSRLGLIRWGGGDPWLPWWLSPVLLAYSAVRGHEKGWPWHSEARSTVPPRRSVYSGGSQPNQSQSHCGQWSIPLPPPTPPQPYQKRVNLCSMAVCLFLLVFAGAHYYPQPAGTPSMFFFPAHS